MIEESYVSFDTARMLKEAGFNVPCNSQYMQNGFRWDGGSSNKVNSNEYETVFSCPTLALAARWLREVHRIVVDVTFIPPLFDGVNWQYFIGNMDDMVWEGDFEPSERKYATYEAAFEAGLQEAIKLITNENENRNNRC